MALATATSCDAYGGRAAARLLVAAAFARRQAPSHLCGVVTDALGVGNQGEIGIAERPLRGGQFAWLDDCL